MKYRDISKNEWRISGFEEHEAIPLSDISDLQIRDKDGRLRSIQDVLNRDNCYIDLKNGTIVLITGDDIRWDKTDREYFDIETHEKIALENLPKLYLLHLWHGQDDFCYWFLEDMVTTQEKE